ncbi:MAG: DciA family protein [Paracoccaceae bacterium]
MVKSPRKTNFKRRRGFEKTASLVQGQIRKAGESRGFAVSRLLTHWADIVGAETARTAVPLKVSYGRGAIGSTLTILTSGAQAPMLQAELPKIQQRVNAVYGYAAISKIRITQTAPTGFSEGRIAFEPAPKQAPAPPDQAVVAKARQTAHGISDASLRQALEMLAENVISKNKQNEVYK